MKFKNLLQINQYKEHKIHDDYFKEKMFLTFEEEIFIVSGVINAVMDNPIIDGVINDKKLVNKYLIVFFALIATDIEFTDDERTDMKEIMEVLVQNEIDKIFYESPTYIYLFDWITSLLEIAQQYNTTFSGTISHLLDKLPEQVEVLQNILENFDEEQFQNVLNFATAANGGRSLN